MEETKKRLKYPPIDHSIQGNSPSEIAGFAVHKLSRFYTVEEIRRIIGLLSEEIAGIPPHKLWETGVLFNTSELIKIFKCIERLSQGEPLAYVLGKTWFYKYEFCVGPGVLIPRPETEELTEMVIAEIQKDNSVQEVLDVGTGSGCIAISVKKSCPSVRVTGLDVSEKALNWAKKNAQKHNVEIHWIQEDIFMHSPKGKSWDIIVSNPPYVSEEEKEELSIQVRNYEPHEALFAIRNPLIYYEKIFQFSEKHLSPNGKIFLECNRKYAGEVLMLSQKYNYLRGAELKKDLSGNVRFFRAIRV